MTAKNMPETVLVTGAGIAGLFTALALFPTGRDILLLERDGPPPEGDVDVVFADWKRRGVGHLRHSHAFLARLRAALEAHPALMDDLHAAGVREITFADMLPPNLKAAYVEEPGDHALGVLTSRRTTLELVMRRFVERQANVRIQSDVFVDGLILEPATEGPPRVVGVTGREAGSDVEHEREWRADVVVDAAGRSTQLFDWLAEAGVSVAEAEEDAGILYYTRHYRLRPGVSEPSREGAPPATGDLGFIKYGLFNADAGWFSITLAVPEIEAELRAAIVGPDTFQQVCQLLPGIARWTDPAISEPMTKVFGMGDLRSRWRSLLAEGQPLVLGLFAIGDGLVRTNPLYGRGTSFAAVEAEALRAALEGSDDPARRLARYQVKIDSDLRPFYEDMLRQDRSAIRRAANARNPDHKPGLRARLFNSFARDGVGVALRTDIATLRAALRGFHMLDAPTDWLKKPRHMGPVLASWAKGKRRNAAHYPPNLGPGRAEMFSEIGLAEAI
ncbi:MAG: FAD-dependent oxidoreductase [Caulobacter sp.]|nr:FAD-dependent oxidoreductase [Caulobacter sp.]